jgi:putative oligomerization/nucleic acid binding protein
MVLALVIGVRFVRSPTVAVVLVIAFAIAYAVAVAWAIRRDRANVRPPPPPPPPKNVTPIEPAIEASSTSLRPRPTPQGVVIDAPLAGTDDLASKLRALDRLRAEGLVSDVEYEAKRAKLIADF